MKVLPTSNASPPSPLPQQTQAEIAFTLAKDPSQGLLTKLNAQVASHAKEAADLDARLRGDGTIFDFESDSLQNRLLAYFGSFKMKMFANPRERLEKAEKRRRVLLRRVERAGLLGVHSKNHETQELVNGFSDHDLSLLHRVVVDQHPSDQLNSPEIIELIARKIREGRGEDIVTYLAKQIEQCRARTRSSKTQNLREVVNPGIIVVAMLWTYPNCPMWLLPSKAAVQIIEKFTSNPLSTAAYNSLIARHHLPRLPQPVLDKFLSVSQSDPECLELREEIEKETGIRLADIARGRRPRPKRVE